MTLALFLFFAFGCSGTESTVTVDIYRSIVPALDDR
jgi:hypothetical protein